MREDTNHESFKLKPSKAVPEGVGVYALHGIREGTRLDLFTDDFPEELREEKDVPEPFRGFCLYQEDGRLLCPKEFSKMPVGCYVNHSESPNMRYEKGKGYFAARDIREGEELLANYRELGEPEGTWDQYFRKS